MNLLADHCVRVRPSQQPHRLPTADDETTLVVVVVAAAAAVAAFWSLWLYRL